MFILTVYVLLVQFIALVSSRNDSNDVICRAVSEIYPNGTTRWTSDINLEMCTAIVPGGHRTTSASSRETWSVKSSEVLSGFVGKPIQHLRTSLETPTTTLVTLATTDSHSTMDGSTIKIEDPLTNASCPMWTPYNGSLYCYIEESTTYEDGTEKCRGYSEHAYIVSIETSDENTFVTNLCLTQATEDNTAATWIGILHRPESFDILTTGENATYHNWFAEAKRWDPCVILRFTLDGQWFDELCWFNFYYVCEYRK